jgi:hypothetical protein
MNHIKKFDQWLLENAFTTPVGIAVLGAPAGGKSYSVKKLSDVSNDVRVERTLKKGVTLTVDVLRKEFASKNPIEQLTGFVKTFYLMKQRAKEDEKEFGKWFSDIKKLWIEKFSQLLPDLKVTVENDELLFNGKSSLDNLNDLEKVDTNGLLDKLDRYNDYKRVVRYFQDLKQEDAVQKKLDVSYDEAGDEPNKIVNNVKKLHNQGYVTDVFLIHPKNIASNLIQNYYRVVTGGDGGRDSSEVIVQAYLDIEKNKSIYTKNAEEVIKVKSSDLEKASKPLKRANVPDDERRGDKPIDLFVEVQPMEPKEAFTTFSKKLSPEEKNIFVACLRYARGFENMPTSAIKALDEITKSMNNEEALKVLVDASASKKYVFEYGGITPKFVEKAQKVLSK